VLLCAYVECLLGQIRNINASLDASVQLGGQVRQSELMKGKLEEKSVKEGERGCACHQGRRARPLRIV
jgi:hypothetical protein